jgi:acyl carrier protein
MTREQWSVTIRSKIETSWNLYQLLPKPFDFYIFFSSLSGIYGSVSQSNYASGCTFQDAFARSRATKGERVLSLDIGWMRTIGIIAETEKYQMSRKTSGDMGQIESEELISALELCCDPAYPLSPENCQLLLGVLTPVDYIKTGRPLPALLQRPLFSGYSQSITGAQQGDGIEALEPGYLFQQASTTEERVDVVIRSLAEKLARALDISAEEVSRSKVLSDYGVDSLMATELREWIGKQFKATVAVFDIMSGTTIAAIGDLVVDRSSLVG